MVKTPRLNLLHARFNGKCWYCGIETWLPNDDAAAQRLFGVSAYHAQSNVEMRGRSATREHLVRKVDGGGNGNNVVLACDYCNQTRGSAPPDVWRALRSQFNLETSERAA